MLNEVAKIERVPKVKNITCTLCLHLCYITITKGEGKLVNDLDLIMTKWSSINDENG
jgi:hypothetical protein